MLDLQIYRRICCICKAAERLKKHLKKHNCVKNYEGSSKGMESAAIVEMVKRAPSRGYVIHWIVSDDNSTMHAHVDHPKTPEGH